MVDAYLHEMKRQEDAERASGKAAAPHGRAFAPRRHAATGVAIGLVLLLAAAVPAADLGGGRVPPASPALAGGRPLAA